MNTTEATKKIVARVYANKRRPSSVGYFLSWVKQTAQREYGVTREQFWFDVAEAAILVGHVTETGRVKPEITCNVREMTEYRLCKVLAAMMAVVEAKHKATAGGDSGFSVERAAIDLVNKVAA